MSRQIPPEDTLPWYRQFWPWFLISLPASVVVAGLSMLYIANRGADDLVVDEYYKDGLAINRQLEKKDRAQALGISAHPSFSGLDVRMEVTGAVTADKLDLRLSHPLEADRDFSVTLIAASPGDYRGRLLKPVAPRWHWTLELPDVEQSWRLDGSIELADLSDDQQP